MKSSVLLLTLVAALTACSPAPAPTGSPSTLTPTAEPSSPLPSPSNAALGTLVVQQSRIIGGFYIEGAFAYVEVTDESGVQVARVEDPEYHLAKELARVELTAGRYLVRSYLRSCAGSCAGLDGPTDGCELTVDIAAADIVEVHVGRQVGRPCLASLVDA